MKKKLLALLLMAAMVLSLAACGGNGNGGNDNNSGNGSSNEGGTTDGSGSGDVADLPAYTIQWAYIGDSYDDLPKVQDEINKILQPEFNCTVNIIPMSWGEFSNQLTLMLSGGEQLDLVPILSGNGATYINNGYVVDMKDLIDQYGTNIRKYIGEDNMYVCTVNGFTYGVPTYKEYCSNAGVMMRKDLLEAAGHTVDEIDSLDDLDAIYADVLAQNPNMVMLAGRQGGTPGQDLIWWDTLSDGFGMIDPADTVGTVVNYYESDEYRNVSQTMYDFAQKGYISKDCATMSETRQAQVKAGTAFSYFTPLKPNTESQDTLDTGYEMVSAYLTDEYRSTNAMTFLGWGIGRTCQYPERVMQVLDYMYGSAEIMNLFNWGIEGEHYQVIDEANGVIDYAEGVTAESKKYGLNIGYEIMNQTLAYVFTGTDPDIWDQYKEYNAAPGIVSTGFIYDNSKVLTQVAALNNVVNQYRDGLGSGALDPAQYIQEFNDALYKAGLQDVMDEKQAQLDAFLGKTE